MAEQAEGSQDRPAINTLYARKTATNYQNRGKFQPLRHHNIIACLNTEGYGIGQCKEIMLFLRRSRIFKAITEEPLVYKNHVQDFWDTATVDNVQKPTKIIAKVVGTKVEVNEGILRRVLEFGDHVEDTDSPSQEKVRGCLTRCGYPKLKGTVYKKFFSPPYKYIAHILVHCLSSKKAGTDTLNESLTSAFAALVMNMNFNFTRMIWNAMTEAAANKRTDFDFILYPRFVQMLINFVKPNLLKEGDILPIQHMDDTTVRYMFNYHESQEKPKDAALWGHLINENYLCPPGVTWSNAGSDYEAEVEVVEPRKSKASKGKRKKDQLIDEALEATGTVQPVKRRQAALAWKQRTPVSPTVPTSSGGTPPIPTSSTNPEGPRPSDSSQRTTESHQSFQVSLVSLMAKFERMEKENREKTEVMQKVLEDKADVDRKLEDMHLLLLRANERSEELAKKNEELESRLKAMEICYDNNQKVMVLDNEGYYRHADHVDDEDLMIVEPSADDAETGGKSHL